jgi:oligoribonuclease NrnB/cAMP/cGMP phosphodiesterase (DHH superfamily)
MHRYYPGDIAFHASHYEDPPPNVRGHRVFVLDFSYPRETLEKMAKAADELTVLDHHKTAEEALAGLPYCTFDMTKSGGQLTWEWLMKEGYPPPKPAATGSAWEPPEPPWLVDYTADRDLWRFALPRSREVNAALRSYPLTFDAWDDLARRGQGRLHDGFDSEAFADEGSAILRAESVAVQAHVAGAKEIDIDGYKVLATNATWLHSEIAGTLAKGRPFGATWFERDNVHQWSLRSDEHGIDVGELARQHGGGGHVHAAGFEVPIPGRTSP